MKKNFKFLLVSLLAVFGLGSVSAAPLALNDAFNNDDYYFVVKTISGTTGTAYITKVNSSKTGAILLPSSVTISHEGQTYTFSVTGIADATDATNAAFKSQMTLSAVTIPSSYEHIGAYAFYSCSDLATITFQLNSKLKTIGNEAFATTQVTEYDFTNCTMLTGLPERAFTENGDTKLNSYITKITLPTSTAFKTVSTSLAKLPELTPANLNIKDTKITDVVANAFTKSDKLTALELPGTVKTIAESAFAGSKVADLTINVDGLGYETATGILGNVYPTADKAVLTKLTLKGTLKGVIHGNAFLDNSAIADGNLDLSDLNFGTHAAIEANAFGGLDLIKTITLGDIADNGSGVYTIQSNAFNGDLLATVNIGNITANNAIGGHAFDDGTSTTLTAVKIESIISGGTAIADAAFNFAAITTAAEASVEIGTVKATDLANVRSCYASVVMQYVEDGNAHTATAAVQQKVENWQTADSSANYTLQGLGDSGTVSITVPSATSGNYSVAITSDGSISVTAG